jgi:hypothetical protein
MPGKVDRVDWPDDAFAIRPGMIVREARLEPLPERADTVRVCGVADDRLLVAVLATSTVRFTGRDGVALLRDERLEVEDLF